MKHSLVLSLLVSTCVFSFASTINVPADQPTIQAAITAAKNGDVVLVAPGTLTKAIHALQNKNMKT